MARLKAQLTELKNRIADGDGILSDIDGFKQTIEDPKTLVLDPDNANVHTPENLQAIRESLQRFGFRKNAIVVEEQSRMVFAGNGLVTVLLQDQIDVCPVLWLPSDMSTEDIKAFALVDNQTARLAEWDFSQLQETLGEIAAAHDKTALGFNDDTLDSTFSELDAIADTFENPTQAASPETQTPMIRLLFAPSDIAIVEKAIRHTGENTRGDAITRICRAYLDAQGAQDE